MPEKEMSAFRGVSRRDFLKFVAGIAAVIGAGQAAVPDLAIALEKLAKRPSVLWSSFGVCTGCAVQLLQTRTPQVAQLILQQISLDYQDNVMAAAGKAAVKSFDDAVNSGNFFWAVEGSVATKPGEAMALEGRPAFDVLKETYPKAKGVIAIGSCSSYGNIQAAKPNPAGYKGIQEWLRQDGGIPDATVVNMPRCPGNSEDLIAGLSYILLYNKLPELDAIGRPKFLYGELIHDNCERRGHFEAGEFVEQFGDEASQKEWCLFKVGCKGPQTFAPCPKTRWNGHLSWCVFNGPCIGCAEPQFWDKLTPFVLQSPGVPYGIGGVSAVTIGEVLGAATVAGLGVHAVAQVATGRWGRGGPPEARPPAAGPGPGPAAPPPAGGEPVGPAPETRGGV